MGSIDAATNSAIILVAIVTSTLSPLLFNRVAPAVDAVHRKFVVVGAGRVPRLVASRIGAHGEEVVVVDRNPDRESAVQEMGLRFILGDATDPALWASLEPETIRAVAVLLPNDEVNLQVCRFLRDELAIQRVVSRVHDATRTPLFSELDVQAINPSLSPVVELEYLLLYPSVSSLITDLEDEHDITEVRLRCAEFTGRPISELDFPAGAIIILVRRDGDVVYPRGHTVLQLGDRLTLVGSQEAVRELARRCE